MSNEAKLALEALERKIDLRNHITKDQIKALRETCDLANDRKEAPTKKVP